MEVVIWVYRCFWAWLPERQLWGTLVICINAKWPLWTPGSPPDGIPWTDLLKIMCDTSLSHNFYPGNWFLGSIWWLEVNLYVKCQVQGHFQSRNVVHMSCTLCSWPWKQVLHNKNITTWTLDSIMHISSSVLARWRYQHHSKGAITSRTIRSDYMLNIK